MTYRIWKSGQDILIETADGRIMLSREDIEGIVKDLAIGRNNRDPEQFAKMWNDGIPRREIAAALGYAESYISNLAKRQGLPARKEVTPKAMTALREQAAAMRAARVAKADGT